MEKLQNIEKQVISEELIYLDQAVTSQDEVLRLIVENAATLNYVSDAEELFRAVKKREAEIPTAIGYDIAIPHGKTAAVDFPFIAFLRTAEGFQWSEKNEEIVRLIFLIGVPEESAGKLHLKFISQLSKKLLDDEFRNKLLTETDKTKIFEQLRAIEI